MKTMILRQAQDEGAARPAALKPIVRAAVDLDQFAKARPTLARAVNPPRPPPPNPSQPEGDLKPANRLPRYRNPVQLAQFLRRQRRPEIRILRRQKLLDPGAPGSVQPPSRNPAALARDQPGVALRPPPPQKPLNLANAQTQPLRRLPLPQKPFLQSPHDVRTLALLRAHRQDPQCHQTPPQTKPPKGTFSCC